MVNYELEGLLTSPQRVTRGALARHAGDVARDEHGLRTVRRLSEFRELPRSRLIAPRISRAVISPPASAAALRCSQKTQTDP